MKFLVDMRQRRVIALFDRATHPDLLRGLADMQTGQTGITHMFMEDLPEDVRQNSFDLLMTETTVLDVKAWAEAIDEGVMGGYAKNMSDEEIVIAMAILDALHVKEETGGKDKP